MAGGKHGPRKSNIINPKAIRMRRNFALRDLARLAVMRNPPYLKLSEIKERAANGNVSVDLLMETLKKRRIPIKMDE